MRRSLLRPAFLAVAAAAAAAIIPPYPALALQFGAERMRGRGRGAVVTFRRAGDGPGVAAVQHLSTPLIPQAAPSTSTAWAPRVDSALAAQSPLFSASAAVDAGTAPRSGALREGGVRSTVVKIMMISYIVSMCVALPATLFPVYVLHRLGLISRIQKENMSLRTGQFCSRWLLRILPFASVKITSYQEENPEPCVWVCNHISMLDVFFMLAADKKLRGKNKRPIKIVYWKGLEANPITRLLFTMCGFISVDMANNGNGTANDYDRSSFKKLLKDTKQAFDEGFDIGILPEGQPNPTPENGLLPVFSGAFTLARMSRRPIHMMALYGLHHLWHPDAERGMCVTGRGVRIRCYPPGKGRFESAEEFAETFKAVVGHFGATGGDLPQQELEDWLSGRAWEALKVEEEKKKKKSQVLFPRHQSPV